MPAHWASKLKVSLPSSLPLFRSFQTLPRHFRCEHFEKGKSGQTWLSRRRRRHPVTLKPHFGYRILFHGLSYFYSIIKYMCASYNPVSVSIKVTRFLRIDSVNGALKKPLLANGIKKKGICFGYSRLLLSPVHGGCTSGNPASLKVNSCILQTGN
jgi:hypothetical protein